MGFIHSDTHLNTGSKKYLTKEGTQTGLEWSESGQHVLIKDSSSLANYTLPKYFKHGNLSSFIRQLNLYSFRKTGETIYSEYYHPNFQKGKENEYRKIKRKARKIDDYEESELPPTRSLEQIRAKLLKLNERQERLRREHEDLLAEKEKLLGIKLQYQQECKRKKVEVKCEIHKPPS